ncbi:hypothetical protein A3D11_02055 [Candidatus Peribacteria bacterium RIFCSPHIGHO2_02_FULL_49_16]|nr:MAG: hypothetical protein A2880_01165 [Candidatus Peribacteria bacterium RIFCSPHIGHO2_01_FULL_49_38]OGJ58697.1 MAG: hypothetical protein A3D11_02055 [Candidatus Peribacteria bacterium RIFCSPHIGHO2_02_FULL_49_16]
MPLHKKFVIIVCIVILTTVAWQSLFPREYVPGRKKVQEGEPCKGRPIVVDYAYNWGPVEPHECKVQCGGTIERYIMYTNGLATQCSVPPACLDYGEDNRVTCEYEVESRSE